MRLTRHQSISAWILLTIMNMVVFINSWIDYLFEAVWANRIFMGLWLFVSLLCLSESYFLNDHLLNRKTET